METILTLVGLVCSWLFAGLVTYGYMKAKTEDLTDRIDKLEELQTTAINRREFDTHVDLVMDQLKRIEEKIDKYFMSIHQERQ